jgi:hypothetical protein
MWDCSIFLGRLAVQSSDRGRERERERERGRQRYGYGQRFFETV